MNNPTPKKGAARCPRFDSCNAPVCPLDAWERTRHLPGEAVCGLLRELVKEGGEARLRACIPSNLVDTLAAVHPEIAARWGGIRRELDRSARTGSRIAGAERLQARKKDTPASNTPRPVPEVSGKACTHGTHPPTQRPSDDLLPEPGKERP